MSIIVAVDRDRSQRELVAEGVKLADALNEELQVVHVMSQRAFREIEEQSVKETNKTIAINEIRKRTEEIAADAASEVDVAATPVGLVGDPADEIVSYANENNASYLLIGGRRRSAVGKALFGSVTQSVLMAASVPVVTVMSDE